MAVSLSLSVLKAAEEFDILLGKLHARNLPEFFELVEERIERERTEGATGVKQRGAEASVQDDFISHSASLLQLKFIFQKALSDLAGKTVVDIGSRLGPVLYGAYFYSSASRIVGIEINPELCSVQEDIIKKFNLRDRIQVVNADVCTQTSLLQEADVIVMHNVFEFFTPSETQISIWKFLRKTLKKKGCLLVTIPSLEKSVAVLKLSMDISSWVKQLPLDRITMWVREDEAKEEVQQICLYEIV